MSDHEQTEEQAAPATVTEEATYRGVLESLVGKKVTVVNPESFEARPREGHELRENYYPGKISALGEDYMIFQTVLIASKKDRQPVKQYIPVDRVKRISMMRGATLLHL